MAARKQGTAHLAEAWDYIADANASAAAELRRKHPFDARLQATADVMDSWAARYGRWAEDERRWTRRTGATT